MPFFHRSQTESVSQRRCSHQRPRLLVTKKSKLRISNFCKQAHTATSVFWRARHTRKCTEGPNASTHFAMDVKLDDYNNGLQSWHGKLTHRQMHASSPRHRRRHALLQDLSLVSFAGQWHTRAFFFLVHFRASLSDLAGPFCGGEVRKMGFGAVVP